MYKHNTSPDGISSGQTSRNYLKLAVMAVSGLLHFASGAFAQSPPLQVVDVIGIPSIVNVNQGENFQVTFQVNPNGTQVTVADIAMNFNPDMIEVVSIAFAPGSPLSNFNQAVAFDNTTGFLKYGGFGFTPATVAFDHIVVTFTATGTGTSTIDHITTGHPKTLMAYFGFNVTGLTPSVEVNVTNETADCPDLGVNNGDPCILDGENGAYAACICTLLDCAGTPGGTAFIDDCGDCIEAGNTPCAPAVLTGSVEWVIFCGARAATVRFYEPGTSTLVATYSTTIFENGLFTIPEVELGTYDVLVKVDQHLQKGFSNVEIVSGPSSLDVGPITDGDLNNDNGINIDDLTILTTAFGTSTGEANFNILADLNCDGAVNIDDLTFLLIFFGQTGDAAPL